jgi:PAS domain S-box-containing protein
LRALFILTLVFFASTAFTQTLRVGIYQNPPLIKIDSAGMVTGFTVDLLSEIAQQNNWKLEYHTYNFSGCLNALQDGDIDLMPALAYSQARDSTFILNQTNVTTNWAKLFKHESDKEAYISLELLRGKRIAVLRDDYYTRNGDDGLLDLIDELDIPAEITYVDSYDAVVNELLENRVDLGLVSRYYGIFNTDDLSIVKTPLNVAYVSIRYGMSKSSQHREIVKALDVSLLHMIGDRTSIYYQLERKYLAYSGREFIPPWLWQTFLIVMIGLTTLAIFTILLQYQVKRKTSELKETNLQLSKSEHTAMLAANTIEASQDIGFWFQAGKPFINVNKAASALTGYSEAELLEMVPKDLLATDKNEEFYESIRQGNWEGHVIIEDEFRKKDGTVFPVEISLDEFLLDGQTFICGFARNITARVKAEYELLEKNKELNCLYSIVQLAANRELSIADIFKRSIKIIPIAWQYPEYTFVRISLEGKIYETDNYAETQWQLNEPLMIDNEKMGMLTIGYSKQIGAVKNPFLAEENNLIKAIANEFNNLLSTRNSEKRVLSTILNTENAERSRISKELHDSVGQTLSAISLHLKALVSQPTISENEKTKLMEIEELVKSAISESRSVSHNLMPPSLTDLGLTYAIENIIESIASVSPTKFIFNKNTTEIAIPKEVEVALFRIVQEAINNTIKYAEASEVTIQYLVYDNEISLSIEDDGHGFDMKSVEKSHNFGLNSMRNRALAVNGEISIDSKPGHGTSIHIQVPIN